jgi:tetratricopeptide (TPR) repeat protein
MLGADSGLNYHDWVVAPNPQGVLKFNDVYVAISGELLSATAHRAYIQGALAANPGLLDRLTGKDKELGDNFAKLAKMADASQAKQYQQVLDTYNTLPAAMQGEKSCMILRLVAAEQLREPSSDQYAAAMADYQRLFPGDPSVDLDCLDGLFFKKKFDDARTSIDGIDNFTGGDPYLQILRGATYKLEGGDRNLLRAKRCYQKAIDEEPTLADGYWSLVALSLDAHDYDETATLLTQIRQKLHMRINDLTKLPTYAGFVQSPAYTKWLAAQPASQAPATQPQ